MIKFHIFGVILTLFFITSCSKSSKGVEVLPKDSKMVLVINPLDLLDKAHVEDLPESDIFDKLAGKVTQDNKKSEKFFDAIKEEPLALGVDFYKDIFLFEPDKEGHFVGLSVDLFNASRFETFIKEKLSKLSSDFEFTEKENYSYVSIDSGFVVGWDDDKALFLIAKNKKEEAYTKTKLSDLFEQDKSDCLVQTQFFSDFYKHKKDLNLWLSLSQVDTEQFNLVQDVFSIDQDKGFMTLSMSFNKGKIVLDSRLSGLQKTNEQVKNADYGKLIKFLPKSYYMIGRVKLDTNRPGIFSKVIDGFIQENKEESGLDMMKGLEGTLVYSLFGHKNYEYTYKKSVYNEFDFSYDYQDVKASKEMPFFSMVFGVKNQAVLSKAIQDSFANNWVAHAGYFETKYQNNYVVYWVLTSDYWYVTNDKSSVIQVAESQKLHEGLELSFDNKLAYQSDFYTFIKLNTASYPDVLQHSFNASVSTDTQKLVEMWNEFASDLECVEVGDKHFRFVFRTMQDKENSLFSLLKLIHENAEDLQPITTQLETAQAEWLEKRTPN